MDISRREWGSFRRRFPSPLPIVMFDFLPRKTEWIRYAFGTCNFSLILRGRGEYHRFGKTWPVHAPCVIVQIPHEPVHYGPLLPNHSWDELYLMYSADLFPALKQARLLDPHEPVWPIRNLPAVKNRIAEIASLCNNAPPEEAVDAVDRLCELLILETRLPAPAPKNPARESLPIRQIQHELASNLADPIDLNDLASRHGMSPATLRRQWAHLMNVSPTRYRLQLRLREACRLLTGTSRPIYEIARLVGFPDELYFSRRFRQHLKLSPRAYRRAYQPRSSNQR